VYERIASLIQRGHSDLSIARALGICNRTVHRYRARRGIPNVYERTAGA
jgi:DNA-binding NarL/FixJ family response regulator